MTLFIIAVLLFVTSFGWTQGPPESVSVNINKARLSWDHDPARGIADEFHVVCDDLTIVVAAPAQEVALVDFIVVPGQYTCHVKAINEFGPSEPSNNVVFNAGTAPLAPTNARLVSQE